MELRELRRPFAERVLDAAHDVCAVGNLRVERGAHREHVGGPQIEQLSDQRGRAEIDGDAKTFARREFEGGFVREDGGVHLGDFERQGTGGPGMAGQSPSGLEFIV